VTTTQYLRVFARFWPIVALCALVGVVVPALGAVGSAPTKYVSTTSVLVSGTAATQSGAADASQTTILAQERMATYAGVADGPTLAEDVLDGHHTHLSLAQLQRRIDVVVPQGSSVMRISVTDTDAHRAQLLASRAGTAAVHIIEDLEKVKGRDFALLHARVVVDATTPTEVPREAAAPGWRNPALGAAAGLLLGMALAVALSRLDPRVGDAEAVEELLEIPVLGVLPGPGSRAPRWGTRPRTQGWDDSVRRLRTNIFFHHPGPERCLTLALTAPHPVGVLPRIGGAVSAALAGTGDRVLLVEADLDEPSDARVFDQYVDSSLGLSAYLAGLSTEDEVIRHDDASGIDVVAAGDPPVNPADLLHSQAFATLMENAAKRYDFVLVNTPAMSVGTDAVAVAARCDGALLVVVRGRTREAQLLDAREQLRRVDAPLLGAVLIS
jgi:succinoglycan biosynthesis transport protein ExoP